MTLRKFLHGGIFIAVILAQAMPALARTRLENICTIYGQKEVRLTGIGLIVGLNGTGDGGDSKPAMRALGSALQRMNLPVVDARELKDSKNVAIVLIEATIPKTGMKTGQRIDCFVSSVMGAKSLRGGRLLATPLTSPEGNRQAVLGLASGAVSIEGNETTASGRIPSGVIIERDVASLFVDKERGHVVTLLLDAAHSTFHSASEVARVINSEFSFETGSNQIAQPKGAGHVDVTIPPTYRESPVEFIAQMLDIGIDNPHTEARVVVNPRTGTIVVTGEVEISPVVIAHKNLTLTVGGQPDPNEPKTNRFVTLPNQNPEQSSQQLQQLVDALNQLRVPASDVVEILRELHRSGKLHAAYEEH